MDFHKDAIHPRRHAGAGQGFNVLGLATAAVPFTTRKLERVGNIEDDRNAKLFHDRQAPHIHDQVIVSEACAPLRHDDALIPGAADLVDGVADVPRRKELTLLDIDDGAGTADFEQQIRLA